MKRKLLPLAVIFLALTPVFAIAQKIDVWIGSGGPDGIYLSTLDVSSGKLTPPKKMNSLGRSGFLALHPNGKTLFATATKQGVSGVASYSIEGSGRNRSLTETSFRDSQDGTAACVTVDQTGKLLFSAQYGGGSTCSYLIDDGKIASFGQKIEHGQGSGVVARRQLSAHPHWVGTTPDNQFLCVPDLGMDAVVVYKIDHENGGLSKHKIVNCPPGSGPRHMKFDKSGKFALVLNELTLTISVFRWDASSASFSGIGEHEALPAEERDEFKHSAAEIRIHPSGKYVYSSNRGHDSISVFEFNDQNGQLKFIERESIRGSIPRNFNIDPTGKWLVAAGQRSNTVAVFQIDPETGKLAFTRTIFNVPNPICVEFGKLD